MTEITIVNVYNSYTTIEKIEERNIVFILIYKWKTLQKNINPIIQQKYYFVTPVYFLYFVIDCSRTNCNAIIKKKNNCNHCLETTLSLVKSIIKQKTKLVIRSITNLVHSCKNENNKQQIKHKLSDLSYQQFSNKDTYMLLNNSRKDAKKIQK